jgi:hypothetical protein
MSGSDQKESFELRSAQHQANIPDIPATLRHDMYMYIYIHIPIYMVLVFVYIGCSHNRCIHAYIYTCTLCIYMISYIYIYIYIYITYLITYVYVDSVFLQLQIVFRIYGCTGVAMQLMMYSCLLDIVLCCVSCLPVVCVCLCMSE